MNNQNFNKSFEALYDIAMNMGDTCIVNNKLENRFDKLEEEYRELIAEFAAIKDPCALSNNQLFALKGELADVLFVLLHIAHKYEFTPFELLHLASCKMLNRINDKNYKAKN